MPVCERPKQRPEPRGCQGAIAVLPEALSPLVLEHHHGVPVHLGDGGVDVPVAHLEGKALPIRGQVNGGLDFVILDTAPGWDALSINVLFYAVDVIAPVSLEVMSLQSLLEFRRSLESIQRYRTELALRYVLPTFLDRRVKKSAEILSLLESHYPQQYCTPIRYSVRLSESPGYGQTIFEYAPQSPGAHDYQALAERILSDDQA